MEIRNRKKTEYGCLLMNENDKRARGKEYFGVEKAGFGDMDEGTAKMVKYCGDSTSQWLRGIFDSYGRMERCLRIGEDTDYTP